MERHFQVLYAPSCFDIHASDLLLNKVCGYSVMHLKATCAIVNALQLLIYISDIFTHTHVSELSILSVGSKYR